MKKILVFFIVMNMCFICSCNNSVSARIREIDMEEMYPDVPGELAILFRNLSEIVDEADVIVQVTSLGKKEELPGGFPQTHTNVRVEECMKGNLEKGSILEVIEEGGHNGKVLGGIPQMQEGTSYFLFLYDDGGGKYYICGAFQGRFIIREGYVFQQATEEVKLKNYTPVTVKEFKKLIR